MHRKLASTLKSALSLDLTFNITHCHIWFFLLFYLNEILFRVGRAWKILVCYSKLTLEMVAWCLAWWCLSRKSQFDIVNLEWWLCAIVWIWSSWERCCSFEVVLSYDSGLEKEVFHADFPNLIYIFRLGWYNDWCGLGGQNLFLTH